jgi:hypothetical protein
MEEITAKLSELSVGKESELALCVVGLAQANERLTAANERLTRQVNNPSLRFARHGNEDLPSNGTIDCLVTTQVKKTYKIPCRWLPKKAMSC